MPFTDAMRTELSAVQMTTSPEEAPQRPRETRPALLKLL
jgi:hypothetical protein